MAGRTAGSGSPLDPPSGMTDPLQIHNAITHGDLDGVRRAFGSSPDFPNVADECGTWCLDLAIYHGPLALVRALLDLGANPKHDDPGGFPPLFAAIDRAEDDWLEVLRLLLDAGADVHQRGLNDYTALHFAACRNDAAAVRILLAHGADPSARTRIDEYATPLEEAERFGHATGAAALRAASNH